MAATVIVCVIIAGIVALGIRHFRKSLLSGCCGSGSDPAPKRIRVKDRDLRNYPYEKILDIEGMTCANCVTHVQNALNSLDGVYSRVDLGKKKAVVHMKAELPDKALRKAVSDSGYAVTKIGTAAP